MTAKSIAELLKIRRKQKAKKPEFLVQDYHRRKELPRKWRKPRGMHSKMRMRKKGHPKQAEIGYGSPKQTRNLDRKGMRRVLVSSAKKLDDIDKSTEVAVISHGVGLKKKLEIIKAAEQKGITVANTSHAKLMKRIEGKKQKDVKTEPKQEAEQKKADENSEEKEKPGEEELKDTEKREKDKLLIKRETR